MPTPKFIRDAPVLKPGLQFFMAVFDDLKTGEAMIDWGMIDRYCQVHGIFGETRELVFIHVRELDKALIRLVTAKQKGNPGGPKL